MITPAIALEKIRRDSQHLTSYVNIIKTNGAERLFIDMKNGGLKIKQSQKDVGRFASKRVWLKIPDHDKPEIYRWSDAGDSNRQISQRLEGRYLKPDGTPYAEQTIRRMINHLIKAHKRKRLAA